MKEKIWLFIGLFFFISSIFFIGGCDTTNAEDDTGTYEYEQSLTYAQLQKEIKTFEEWGDDVYCNNKCRVMTVPKGTENWSNISKCRIALYRCTKGVSGIIERTKTTCTDSYVPEEKVVEPTMEDVPVDTVKTDTTIVDTTIVSDSTATDSSLTDIATQPEETSTDSI